MSKITSRKYNMYKFNIRIKYVFFFCYRVNKEEKEEKEEKR